MKITQIKLYQLNVGLKKPFKTALRTVETAVEVIVKIFTDQGLVGIGEAPPTAVITGETTASICALIASRIRPLLVGEDPTNLEKIHFLIEESAVNNHSAKAAVEIAIYDLLAQSYQVPLFRFLGGYRNSLTTDLTISVNSPAEMREDALTAVADGYQSLKIKVGKNSKLDLARIKAISQAVGPEIKLRLDANQAWHPKQAVYLIRELEKESLALEFVEQPVPAADLTGLKYVKDNVLTAIMADESLFNSADCLRLIKEQACDLLNIKLMKTGGIYNALQINSIAQAAGIKVMLGSMLEAKVSVTAAAHLAAAKKNIVYLDLDAPQLLAEDPVQGGIEFSASKIKLAETPGLGIKEVANLTELSSYNL